MRLITILITLLLIGGFTSGMMGFYSGLLSHYSMDSSIAQNFSSNINQTTTLQNNITSMMELMGAENEPSTTGTIVTFAPLNLIFNAYNAGMLVLKTPSIFQNIITTLADAWTIPGWVTVMLFAIIGLIVLGTVIYFITGREVL